MPHNRTAEALVPKVLIMISIQGIVMLQAQGQAKKIPPHNIQKKILSIISVMMKMLLISMTKNHAVQSVLRTQIHKRLPKKLLMINLKKIKRNLRANQ
jgi:hypothetical protein